MKLALTSACVLKNLEHFLRNELWARRILTPFDHFHFRPALAVKCIPDLRVRFKNFLCNIFCLRRGQRTQPFFLFGGTSKKHPVILEG